jgi:hypothetical protein
MVQQEVESCQEDQEELLEEPQEVDEVVLHQGKDEVVEEDMKTERDMKTEERDINELFQ